MLNHCLKDVDIFLNQIHLTRQSNDQIYQGSYLQLIEGAIQLCPDQVPEKDKKKFMSMKFTII